MLKAIGLTLTYIALVCMVLVSIIAYVPITLYSTSEGGGIGVIDTPILLILHKPTIINDISDEICNITLIMNSNKHHEIEYKGEILVLEGVSKDKVVYKLLSSIERLAQGFMAEEIYLKLRDRAKITREFKGSRQRISIQFRVHRRDYAVVIFISNTMRLIVEKELKSEEKTLAKAITYGNIDYIITRSVVLGDIVPIYLRFLIPLGLGIVLTITNTLWRRRHE